jgi:hypothetical protein
MPLTSPRPAPRILPNAHLNIRPPSPTPGALRPYVNQSLILPKSYAHVSEGLVLPMRADFADEAEETVRIFGEEIAEG